MKTSRQPRPWRTFDTGRTGAQLTQLGIVDVALWRWVCTHCGRQARADVTQWQADVDGREHYRAEHLPPHTEMPW